MKKYILIFLGLSIASLSFCALFECNKTSTAIDSNNASSIVDGDNMTIEKDIERLKSLYLNLIEVSRICIKEERISPENLKKMNFIILKLNFYRDVYQNKYHSQIHSDLLKYVLNQSQASRDLISEYVYISSQLKQLDGYQYLNL